MWSTPQDYVILVELLRYEYLSYKYEYLSYTNEYLSSETLKTKTRITRGRHSLEVRGR